MSGLPKRRHQHVVMLCAFFTELVFFFFLFTRRHAVSVVSVLHPGEVGTSSNARNSSEAKNSNSSRMLRG